jgi:hypothetical protein
METSTLILKKTLTAGVAALTLLAAPVFMTDTFTTGIASAGIISEANAAEEGGKGQQGAGGGAGQGQKGAGGQGGQGGQGGKKGMDKVLEADEDSDRPPWAGGNTAENPHSGGGGGKPADAGTMKGDEYGDLIVLARDPLTGEPLTNTDGELLICLDVACTQTVPTEEGEIPAGVTPVEVEFGRAAVARSPSKVIDKALADAISKLTATGAVISQDEAGRITITVGGVTTTIDSPLENLALYVDLMTGLASNSTSDAEAALGSLATLDVAASLLAGVADKTGDISIDYVVYNNVIADVVDSTEYYDFSSFSYTRSFPTDYSYFYTLDGGATVLSATLDVNDYLDAVNGALPTDGGVTLFAAAADDALEVIELVHTQIHTEVLPGTVTP